VVGPSAVDGVPTTEYRASVDLSKVAGQAGAAAGAASSLARGVAQAFGLGTVPVSVWVDDRGRVRQLAMDVAILRLHVDMTIGLSDFGEASR